MHLRRAAVFLSLAALVPAAARADESLGTMTVSANRTETAVAASGSSVTVITAEEIEKKQAVTALDVIKDVPGVTTTSYGGLGKGGGFSMRGISGKGILVMIDGVNVADPTGTQVQADLAHLMADDIERIEVLRGNQSTLYGSSAIGGVISITTKTGKGSGKMLAGTAGAEFGSYRTGKEYLNLRGETGGIYYSGSIIGLDSAGFDSSPTGSGNTGEKDGTTTRAANLRVGSDLVSNVGILDRLNVEALGSFNRSDREFDASATSDADYEDRTTQKTGRVSLTAEMFGGVLSNTLSASQNVLRRDYYLDGNRDGTYGSFDGEITKYEYQGTLKPIDNHTLVFGADHQRDHANLQNDFGSLVDAITNDGVYGNYILDLLDDRLTLTAGFRRDDNEAFGNHNTWRSTASYRIPEVGTRFHGGYGTGFRAPSLYELYDGFFGNADLKPEKSRGYDAGVEQSFFDDRLVVDTTFFNTRLSDAITFDSATSRYTQISSARTFGVENSVTAHVTEEISVSGAYTWQQARDNSTDTATTGIPRHSGNVRVSYAPDAVEGLETWMRTRFSSEKARSTTSDPRTVGGYAVFDLGASYAVTDWATIYGRVENLTDKDYHVWDQYGESGRAGYVGLRAKF